jgi:hypothetical protein
MGNPSYPGAPGSRKITYSRRATPASNGFNSTDEAKGEEAYDRIRQSTRRGIQTGAQRAANLHNGGAQSKLPPRPGCLKKPSTSVLDAVRHESTRSTESRLKPDMNEAIARPLADSVPPSTPLPTPRTEEEYESDVAQAKRLSMLANNEPSRPPSNKRSYKNLGNGSTSSATAPHARLHSLHEVMKTSAETLEKADSDDTTVDIGKMAKVVKQWEGTVLKTIYAIEAAEDRRIKDLQGQLDFDREIQEKHQKKLETSNKMWEVKLRQKEQAWKKKLDEQKQAYEAQLTAQKDANNEHQLNEETSQPRPGRSPSPHDQTKIARLTQEIATPKAEHEAKLTNSEATQSGTATFLKQKAERLANGNAELRKAHKSSDDDRIYETARTKKRYESQIKQLKEENERLAHANRRLSQGKQETTDGQERDGDVEEPSKMEVVEQTQGGLVKDEADTSTGVSQESTKQQPSGQATRSPLGSASGSQVSSRKRNVNGVASNSSEERFSRRTLHSVVIPRSGGQVSPGKRKLENGSESRSESASWSPKKARTGSVG